jgi:hypothetical protein
MNTQDIHIIAFCGGAKKGKDLSTSLTMSLLTTNNIVSKRFSYGDLIKSEVAKGFNVSTREIEDNKEFWRPMLQTWANDFRRDYQQNQMYWTDKIKTQLHEFYEQNPQGIGIISDMRRLLDLHALQSWYKVKSIYLDRVMGSETHISETEIKRADCEYLIENNGSMEELNNKIINMLKVFRIIL